MFHWCMIFSFFLIDVNLENTTYWNSLILLLFFVHSCSSVPFWSCKNDGDCNTYFTQKSSNNSFLIDDGTCRPVPCNDRNQNLDPSNPVCRSSEKDKCFKYIDTDSITRCNSECPVRLVFFFLGLYSLVYCLPFDIHVTVISFSFVYLRMVMNKNILTTIIVHLLAFVLGANINVANGIRMIILLILMRTVMIIVVMLYRPQ
jgi:hypothetical protein